MAPKPTFNIGLLAESIPTIFDQAQTSTATHKKNCVALWKLHMGAASVVESLNRGSSQVGTKLVGEKAFNDLFLDMIDRILAIKKGSPAADRVVRFIGNYAKFMSEKAAASQSSEDDDDDTTAGRFISRLLKHVMKGLLAKNKVVRYRVASIIAEMICHLGEIDEALYMALRESLLDRLQDKEPVVRSCCVIALANMAAVEDPKDLADGEQPVIMFLLDCLCYDESPEVRRAALMHIPVLSHTLPQLLTRTRDVDAVTRKLLYSSVLPKLDHPKRMTISQRELVVRQGLGDREDTVRVAAAKLLTSWFDLFEGDIVSFLKIFDIITGEVAADALKSIFLTRPDVLDSCNFDDAMWNSICPETALLVRIFVEHCIQSKDDARLESSLPVVTALAFRIQTQYNRFLDLLKQTEITKLSGSDESHMPPDPDLETLEESMTDVAFILSEMVRLAVHLDYADEIGRRKMFGFLRDMIAHDSLPDTLIQPCLDVLEVLSSNERDSILLLAEVINELRHPIDFEETNDLGLPQSYEADDMMATPTPASRVKADTQMTLAERAEADRLDVRCLTLCIGVLEKVKGSIENNPTLGTILSDLVVPSIKRKELVLREKGLISLGLCCLVARNMALNSFQLFLNQLQSSPEALKLKVLHIVFDVMMAYEKDFFAEGSETSERILAFLMQTFEEEESGPVQALICIGLSKLMLLGLVTDGRVLASLVLAYVSPVTADNQELRQCLAYFLPVYCYSSSGNQHRMQSIFLTTYDLVVRAYDDLEDDQVMISPHLFAQLFADWTNPQNVVSLSEQDEAVQRVQVDLAVDLLKALYDSECSSENQKTFCQLLTKLYLPDEIDTNTFNKLYILVSHLREQCPFEDATIDKIFLRFQTLVSKRFTKQIKNYDDMACFGDEAYKELFDFIGVSAPRQRLQYVAPSDTDTIQCDEPSADAEPRRRRSPPPSVSEKSEPSGSSAPSNAEDSSSEGSRPTSPTPLTQKGGRGQVNGEKTKPSLVQRTSRREKQEETAPTNADGGSVVEPSTPVRKRGAKRTRSPARAKTMASPAHKRPSRVLPTKEKVTKVKTAKSQPLSEATNGRVTRSKASGNTRAAPRRQNRNADDDDENVEILSRTDSHSRASAAGVISSSDFEL